MRMKVLMIGLGGIGQRHIRNLRSLLGSRLEVLAYRVRKLTHVVTEKLDVEPASNVEEKYEIQACYDLDEALARRPDIVFVCNPSSLHVPVARAAARAGCHLFIEKPLSHNYEGIEELIELVESGNLVCLMGFQMRFHPCLRYMRDRLKRNAIGRVLAVRADVGEYLPGFHRYEDYRRMYASRTELGGGVILSQIHELDYIYSLFGLPRRVFAMGGHLSSLEIDVEDVASIVMECVVDGRPVPVHLHQDYVQRPPSRTCRVIGDNGKLEVDFRDLSAHVYDAQGNLEDSVEFSGFDRNRMFIDELNHLLRCLNGEEPSAVSIRDGARSLRMALAAKESLVTGNVVEL